MQAANTAGKWLSNAAPIASRRIEENRAAEALLAFDRPGHDIARREVAGRVIAAHEGLALGVHQARALAAQGLGGQGRGIGADVDGRGVELDEFRIGDLRPGHRRQGQALAAHGGGVGGHRIEAAQAAGGEDRRGRGDLDHAAVVFDQGAAHPPHGVAQQRPSPRLPQNLDVAGRANRGDHRAP